MKQQNYKKEHAFFTCIITISIAAAATKNTGQHEKIIFYFQFTLISEQIHKQVSVLRTYRKKTQLHGVSKEVHSA